MRPKVTLLCFKGALVLLFYLLMNWNFGNLLKMSLLYMCLSTSVAMGQEIQAIEGQSRGQVSSADRIARKIIQSLPESNTKNGLLRYYSILAPTSYLDDDSVGFKNSGIANFFEYHFKRNTCFAETAYEFYSELRTETRQNQKLNPDQVRHSRPSLADVAGGTRKDLKAGWLWEKALKHTRGNANAAITLIGLCGHDDVEQGDFFNAEALKNLTAKGHSEESLQVLFSDVSDDGEADALSFCPDKEADFFVSSSLGKNIDISSSLKEKILYYQYPGKKAEQIASKNYHILGAAFMTCQMIEAGLHPLLAVQVETTAASLYRGIRLCQNVEQPAWLFRLIQKSPEIRKKPYSMTFEEFVVKQTLETGKSGICAQEKVANSNAYCQVLEALGAPSVLSLPRLEERAKSLLNKNIDNIIASGVYASWTITGDIFGVSLPCTRDQIFGPHPFLKWLVAQGQLPLNLCGQHLSTESCRKALNKIRAWEVDFDWTISQHQLGANFAARNCQRSSQKTPSLEFCRK